MYLAVTGQLAGLVAVSDPIKETTAEALASLKRLGIRTVMATGDSLTTARTVGRKLGIDEVHGEVKPADKLELVSKLQGEGRIVAMAGDGINDAPALAKADIGVAMGPGTDVAMNSAQVTLVRGDLRGIAQARRISEDTVANMKQNLGFAFVQRARDSAGRWRSVPAHWMAPLADDCLACNEPQLRIGDYECAQAPGQGRTVRPRLAAPVGA